MTEWILLVSITLSSPGIDLSDLSFDTIPGFTSEQRCKDAGSKIGAKLLMRRQQIHERLKAKKKQFKSSTFSVSNECIKVEK